MQQPPDRFLFINSKRRRSGISRETIVAASGPRQWFRPEELIADYNDGEEISTWRDHSEFQTDGTGAQLPGLAEPWEVAHEAPLVEADSINNLPAARLLTATKPGIDPVQSGLYFDLNLLTDLGDAQELLIVLKVTTSQMFGSWHFTGADNTPSRFSNASIVEAFGCPSLTAPKTFTPTIAVQDVWRVYQVTAADGDWRAWLDGVLQFEDAAHDFYDGRGVFLGRSNVAALPLFTPVFAGRIAEYILWNRQLTTSERAAALDYAVKKYALPQTPEPLGGLSDDFDDGSIDASIWETDGVTITEAGGQLRIQGSTTAYVRSISDYDLTGKTVTIQFVDVNTTPGEVGSQQFAVANAAYTSGYIFYVLNGFLSGYRLDTGTVLFQIPYNLAHGRVRMSFIAGTARFEASPDGITWAEIFSEAIAMTITALRIYPARGANGGTPGTVTQKWDNFDSDVT